jgi:hypothetical protein
MVLETILYRVDIAGGEFSQALNDMQVGKIGV